MPQQTPTVDPIYHIASELKLAREKTGPERDIARHKLLHFLLSKTDLLGEPDEAFTAIARKVEANGFEPPIKITQLYARYEDHPAMQTLDTIYDHLDDRQDIKAAGQLQRTAAIMIHLSETDAI